MKFKQIRCFRCYPSFSLTIHICFQINILLNVLPDEVPTTKFRVSPEDSTELFRAESISVSRLLAVPELEDVADVLDVAVVVVEKQLSFDIFFIKKVFYFWKVFFQSRFICLWISAERHKLLLWGKKPSWEQRKAWLVKMFYFSGFLFSSIFTKVTSQLIPFHIFDYSFQVSKFEF